MIRRASWLMVGITTIACVTLTTGSAQASAIDNWASGCRFEFDQNSNIQFLNFSNGKKVSDLSGPANYFLADTDSSGNMTFAGSGMQVVPTDAFVGGNKIYVRLFFTDLTTSTTDLSGADPDIDWTITAKAQFTDQGSITTGNCQTNTFNIHVTGDWGNTTSAAFTIPALTGSGNQACATLSSSVNTALGLGTSGATLTLYKFTAYNTSVAPWVQLYGS